MPTVVHLRGWRLHFYSNEGNEPIHIHAEKGEKDCKYWLDIDQYDIREAYAYNMNSKDTREVRKIILQNFDEIVEAWNRVFGGRS
jgi:meiotically up-regulated gene 157 (Mug157) protein